jgi:uncharacterized membrane protein YbhN (UPF0104 family)
VSEHDRTDGVGRARGYLRRGGRLARDHGLWLTAVLSVGVFLALFLLGEASRVAGAIAAVDLGTLLAVFALVSLGYLIRFAKWAYYLRELEIDVPLRSSALTFFSGLMLVVTPGKVGEVWKAWFLRDIEGVPASPTTAVVGAERVTDLLALTGLASLGVLLYDRSATLLAVVVLLFLGGLLLLQWRRVCLWLIERSRALPVIGGHAGAIESFYEGSYALFRPRPLAVATAISLLAWGLEGAALWLVLGSLASGASLVEGLFVFGLGTVVGAASLLPGGLAATEASMVGTLLALGFPSAVAAAATLVIRVGTLWYGALVGATVFGVYRFATRER